MDITKRGKPGGENRLITAVEEDVTLTEKSDLTNTGRKIKKKRKDIFPPLFCVSVLPPYSALMLSTGRFLAIAYTGRKVATTEVRTAIPSITSQDTGPNTNIDAPRDAAT